MKYRFAAIALLILQSWLELSTLAVTTPTVDEPLHIMRGSAYVRRGEERYLMYGPVLSDALSGIALIMEPDLQLPPPDDPVWTQIASMNHPDAFVWSNAVPPQRIFFWGRLPIIAVSLMLGAFIFRWARERAGGLPALGALALYVFCPNLLAHSRLATTDSVTAATFLISAYAFQRALNAPRSATRFLSGAALGLAFAAKFSAAALPLAFALETAGRAWQARRERRPALTPFITLTATILVGGLTLWAIYRFQMGPIEPGGLNVPAPYYWAEWQALNQYLQDPLAGYLFGQLAPRGWWYYYPIAFLVKTPLPVLILAILAVWRTVRARSWIRDLTLYLAPGLYFGALLFSPHDLGYRYLLPVAPFIFVASADVIAAALAARGTRIAVGLLIAWQIIGALRYHPYYLTFFNEIIGGPDRGRYILSDSNIDWGQDLIGLKQYVDDRQIERIQLSYFGVAHPDAYGLSAELQPPLISGIQDPPQERWRWDWRTFYPADPLPGVYAISVNNLMYPSMPYAIFRDRMPEAIIGGSIYVYDVPARGASIDLALGGLQIDHIDPGSYARFNTNDVRLRWFRPADSLIAPPGAAWIALVDQALAPELTSFLDGVRPEFQARALRKDSPYSVYHFELGQRLLAAAQAAQHNVYLSLELYPQLTDAISATLPVRFGDALEFISYHITPADETNVTTYWGVTNPATAPTELFVHALNPDGQIVAQRDGFGAAAYGWRAGDVFVQISRLAIPRETGPVWIEIGLYNPNSGERLPVLVDGRPIDSRLLLRQIELP
ncbi:MAG TPA: glycosyltransferase family 39 protein [Anaerolineae bacterium]|nr:glycosyltransferase family 39 protein [Anaerolineae bacterium]